MDDQPIDYRWGIPALDSGFTLIPNFIMRHYIEVGLSRPEFLFVLHLASYKFNSPRGQSHPSLRTIAAEMGYEIRQVQYLRASLEKQGMLEVFPRVGDTSIYGFQKLALACLDLDGRATPPVLGDNPTPQCTPVPQDIPAPQCTTPCNPVHHPLQPSAPPPLQPSAPKEEEQKKKKQQQQQQPEAAAAAFSKAGAEGNVQEGLAAAAPNGRPEAVAISRLREMGVEIRVVRRLMENFPAERILEVVAECEGRGNVKRPAAWIVAALDREFETHGNAQKSIHTDELRKQMLSCAFYRKPAMGACPAEELGKPAYPWCRACKRSRAVYLALECPAEAADVPGGEQLLILQDVVQAGMTSPRTSRR